MNTTHYKSLLFYAPQDVRVELVPYPKLQAGEVRITLKAATTCGTDFKTYNRGHPVLIKTIPSPMGHEMSGVVSEVAHDVTSFQIGDRVVIPNSAPCLRCFFCQKNQPNLCENLVFLNGAYAESIVVPEQIVRNNLHEIPDNLNFEKAALTEPLACVLNATDHMKIQQGETVVIIGTGPMAFLFIDVLKARGAIPILIGRNSKRLEMAKQLGVKHLINNTEQDMVQAVQSATKDYGADVAIEATGQPEIWEQAVSLVRKGGRVCLYGGCPKGTEMKLDTYRLHYEEISIHGVFHHTPAAIKKAIQLLTEDKIHTGFYLKEERSLDDLPKILAKQDNPIEALKFVIKPDIS